MRSSTFGYLVLSLSAAVVPMLAHHSIAAEYDDKKPMTLRGTVTRFEWTNPHVYLWLDIRESEWQDANWAVEYNSTLDLKERRNAGTRPVQVGDTVTAEESRPAMAAADQRESLTIASGRRLQRPRRLSSSRSRTGASRSSRWPTGTFVWALHPAERLLGGRQSRRPV